MFQWKYTMKCKFCFQDSVKIVKNIKSFHIDKNYQLYYCNKCKSQFFDYKQHDITIDQLYEDLALKKQEAYTLEFTTNEYWENQKNVIIKLLKRNPKSVLDVGCRTGDFLMHFEDSIMRDGVELSSYYANIAKKRGLNIYNDFLENIDFNKKQYDVVTAYAILEHLLEPFAFLDKLNLLVNKDGLLLVSIPTYECLKTQIYSILNYRWQSYSPPEHLNFYSKYFLDNYLYNNGFKLLGRFYTSGGGFNPFLKIPVLNKIFGKLIDFCDNTVINKIPVFECMYSIYKKI